MQCLRITHKILAFCIVVSIAAAEDVPCNGGVGEVQCKKAFHIVRNANETCESGNQVMDRGKCIYDVGETCKAFKKTIAKDFNCDCHLFCASSNIHLGILSLLIHFLY